MAYGRKEIREAGPAPASQAWVWDRGALFCGAKPAQAARERGEAQETRNAASAIDAALTEAEQTERAERRALRGLAGVAQAARFASKQDAARERAEAARVAAVWARFRGSKAFRDAFTPSGRVAKGWILVGAPGREVPCYEPAARAALGSYRGIAA